MNRAQRDPWSAPVGQVLGTFFLTGCLALLVIVSMAALLPISPAGRLTVLFASWPPVWVVLMCWYALGVQRKLFWAMHGVLALLWAADILPL